MRQEKYVAMTDSQWSIVYHTKDMFSTKVLLGDDYTVERMCGMSKEVQDRPFLSAMMHLAVRCNSGSVVKILLRYGKEEAIIWMAAAVLS